MTEKRIKVSVDPSEAKSGAAEVNRSLDSIRKKAKTFSEQFREVDERFVSFQEKAFSLKNALAGLGVGLAINQIKDTTNQFNTALSQSVGLAGATRAELDGVRKSILDLAPAVGRGPVELAEAFFFISSAGAEGAEAMAILEASAKAAASGMGDTQTIADAVTSAIGAYGSESLDAATAVSVLVNTVREGKAEADAIAGSMGKVLPLAAQMGVEFHEVGAAVASMTRLGLGAEESITQLRAVFANLIKPSSDAEKVLAAVGLSSEQLRNVMSEEGLLAALTLLKDRFEGNDDALARVLPDINALSGALNLVGKNAATSQQIFAGLAGTTGGELQDAFEKTADEGRTLAQEQARLDATMVRLGETVLPAVTQAMQWFGEAIEETVSFAEFLGEALAKSFHGSADPIERIDEQIQALNENIKIIEQNPIHFSDIDEKRIAEMREEIENLRKTRASLVEDFNRSSGGVVPPPPEDPNAGLPAPGGGGGGSPSLDLAALLDGDDTLTKAREKLAGLQEDLKQQAETFGESETAILRYRLTMGDLSEAVKEIGPEAAAQVEEILALSESLEAMKEKADIKEQLQQQVDTLGETLMTELEREQEFFESRQELIQQALENELVTREEGLAMLAALEEQHEKRVTALKKQEMTAREQFQSMSLDKQAADVFGALESMSAGVANSNRKMFELNKAAATANAIVSTYQGVARTLAEYPFPVSAIMAAAQLAIGIAQVRAIQSAKFGGGTTPSAAGSTPTFNGQPVGAAGGPAGSGGAGENGGSTQAQVDNRERVVRVRGIPRRRNWGDDEVRDLMKQVVEAQQDNVRLIVDEE